MPCDTKARPGQTLDQRKLEVREAIARLSQALVAGRARAVVGRNGGIAFTGTEDLSAARVTDACAYRLIMATGSALAKQAIARAEQLAGRVVDRQAIAHGLHSHDGGHSWHAGH